MGLEEDMAGKIDPDAPVIAAKGWREIEDVGQSALTIQIGGDHYKKMGAYQPWEVFARCVTPDELRGFGKCTAMAYLMRERDKGGFADIKKARHTLQLLEELLPICEKFHGSQA